MFGVTVSSPKLGREFAEMTKCPTRKQLKRDTDTKEFTCHRLDNGTTSPPTGSPPGSATTTPTVK
jgi:hypothetical protein